jgi:hypothetical protein
MLIRFIAFFFVLTASPSSWAHNCERLLEIPPIPRHIQILTDGSTLNLESAYVTDSPDPSLVMPITYPDGRRRFRISFTGMHFVESDEPADFYTGRIHKIQRARGFYPDGTEMVPTYDGSAWPWDVVVYENAYGKQIAFGGVMEQPAAGELPSLAMNPTRSRWWGEVKHVPRAEGGFEEHIYWKGPLHDFNRAPRPSVWEGHGYGGNLLTRFNPESGIEEKFGLPWVTSMFAREVNPSLTSTVGPEFPATNIVSPKTGEYFRATRRGVNGETGYLAEGGNTLLELERNQLIKAWSANDFTRRYGIYLDYLPPGHGPLATFQPVVDDNGELIDFAETLKLREAIHGTWVGRPQLEYAPDGKLWLRFHFVPTDNLPEGAPLEGPPPEYLIGSYPRYCAQIPVRFSYDRRGQPHLEWDLQE